MLTSSVKAKAGSKVNEGARCESHVGEIYPPRCSECDRVTGGDVIDRQETARLGAVISRAGYIPGSECPQHENYPLVSTDPPLCDRCKREAAGVL